MHCQAMACAPDQTPASGPIVITNRPNRHRRLSLRLQSSRSRSLDPYVGRLIIFVVVDIIDHEFGSRVEYSFSLSRIDSNLHT